MDGRAACRRAGWPARTWCVVRGARCEGRGRGRGARGEVDEGSPLMGDPASFLPRCICFRAQSLPQVGPSPARTPAFPCDGARQRCATRPGTRSPCASPHAQSVRTSRSPSAMARPLTGSCPSETVPLYLYLDERHVPWMTDATLHAALADLRPMYVPAPPPVSRFPRMLAADASASQVAEKVSRRGSAGGEEE